MNNPVMRSDHDSSVAKAMHMHIIWQLQLYIQMYRPSISMQCRYSEIAVHVINNVYMHDCCGWHIAVAKSPYMHSDTDSAI